MKYLLFVTKAKLNDALKDAEKRGEERKKFKITELEIQLKRTQTKLEETTIELDSLKKLRMKAVEIRKLELDLEIQGDEQEAQQTLLDSKQKRLDSRIKDLEKEEADQYKKGYADGVSDGVRKVTEITQQDRDNLTKIAMVSAARGSDTAQVEGVVNALQLTSGNKDKQVK